MAQLSFVYNLTKLILEEGSAEIELDAGVIWLSQLVLNYVRDACKQSAVFSINLILSRLRLKTLPAGPRPLILIKDHFFRLVLKCSD